jgi:sensor histidine kinase regulating citrate/malate metabolism
MRVNKLFHPSLQLRITGLVTLVVLLVLLIVGISFSKIVLNSIEYEVGHNALEIAHFVSVMPAVQKDLMDSNPADTLQPLIEHYQQKTNAKFIVILNNNGIRYTHPNNELIGKMFTGGDEGPALKGAEYISKAKGVSGPSIRAFAPIIDPLDQRQLGVVVVGMYETNLFSIVKTYTASIIFWLLVGLAVGIVGSIILAKSIKNILHGLEPDQIARLFEEREAMLESLREGVVAVDYDSRITLINSAARKLLSLEESAIGQKVTDIVENSSLPRVIKSEKPEKDLELIVNGVTVLTDRTPIKVGTATVGAVATLRDMTEVRILAEELTGVKSYVEGLRAKTHEFMNKLQTVSGLLELEEYEKAKQYIKNTTIRQQKLMQFLNMHIHDPKTTGLILGKTGQAQEMNIDISIDPGSHLEELEHEIYSDLIVLVLGNLLENAIDSLKGHPAGEIIVCILDEAEEIALIVEDNGPGIPENQLPFIFEKGFSTKGVERGYGLFLIKSQVELHVNGQVTVSSSEKEGTSFVVRLPKNVKNGRRNQVEHSNLNC